MATVTIGDVEIAYETYGEGPPLLMIMGFTGSRHHWLGFERRFADRFRVIAFDNRGVGESGVTRGPYSTAQMAGDALGLLDALDVPRAHVMGVSMGGMIAEELALAAPQRVDRLVLGCTHFGGPNQILPAPGVLETFTRAGKQAAEKTIRDLLELNFTMRFMNEHPEVVDDLVRHGLSARMSPFGFWGQSAAIAGHDVEARLGAITAPTLVIAGDEDRLIPVENSRVLASLLPSASLVELPGIAHMFWVEAPDAAEAAVRRALC
jgi:pimeloyl-ACP methyl ester carboxylesterase